MTENILPRFRGIAIQDGNDWIWELLITFLGDGDEGIALLSNNKFRSKEDAIKDMKIAIQDCTEKMCKELKIEHDSTSYIDMKTNDRRKWDLSDSN